ncbi:MAG: TIGR04282 family arsenosugar biosynthesis glycosyltransferase [Deltaproteobacteria bacterium]|nr:TIGR04282 family arsenosugar biosynthesis glycosyltransferase [Deltaproteobacteria bacterium]
MEARIPVCIFAKPPRAGLVKTRLAAALGREAAAELARAFLRDTWHAVSALPWARPILATTEPMSCEIGLDGAEVWIQGPGDLGSRLERILCSALNGHRSAIALGADTPGLPVRFLTGAKRALESADSVIGPCDDGGFYIVGLTRCFDGIFREIPWSTAATFEKTRDRFTASGFSPVLLPRWFDVDTPKDLARLADLIARHGIRAPETLRLLRSMNAETIRGEDRAARAD